MQTVLGTHKRKFLFSCAGTKPPGQMMEIAKDLIQLAGMTIARQGRVDKYPYEGKGGEGYTLYQPLCESYLVVDVYTDLEETEILLSTCRPDRINLDALRNYLECRVGQVKEIGTL